jgi:hypothetical protein
MKKVCIVKCGTRSTSNPLRCGLAKTIPMLGTVAFTLLVSLPSHADWVLHHYETAGSNSAPEAGRQPAGPWDNPGYGHVYDGEWTSEFFPGGSNNGNWTVAAQGKVTAVFKWNDEENDFPGGQVVILVKSRAWGQALPEVNLQLNPGTTLLSQQDPDQESDSEPGQFVKTRKGAQLFTKQVAAGETEVKQEISLSSVASGSAAGGAAVQVFVSAVKDNRTVTLSNDVFDSDGKNWRKGSNGEGVENVRSPNGSVQWDSAVIWVPAQDADYWQGTTEHPAHAYVHSHAYANAPGFPGTWAILEGSGPYSTYRWQVTGEISAYRYTCEVPGLVDLSNLEPIPPSIVLAQNLGGDVSNYPRSSNFKVDVTDSSDGATAMDSSAIRWHLPFETTGDLDDKREFQVIAMLKAPESSSFAKPLDPEETFNIAAGIEGLAGVAGAAAGAPGGPVGVAVGSSLAYAIAGFVDWKWTYKSLSSLSSVSEIRELVRGGFEPSEEAVS